MEESASHVLVTDACSVRYVQVSASVRSTVVITRGVDRGSGLVPVNEVYQWGQGTVQPSRVNFNGVNDGGSPSRWQTHDARVNIVQLAAAKNHNVALSSVGQVFAWGFGADNLGENFFCYMCAVWSTKEYLVTVRLVLWCLYIVVYGN